MASSKKLARLYDRLSAEEKATVQKLLRQLETKKRDELLDLTENVRAYLWAYFSNEPKPVIR